MKNTSTQEQRNEQPVELIRNITGEETVPTCSKQTIYLRTQRVFRMVNPATKFAIVLGCYHTLPLKNLTLKHS